jgi:hypothetical protein
LPDLDVVAHCGFLRSLHTALNALTYSDIDRADTSNATTFYAVAQQFSLSAGVAVAAFVLEAVQAWRGEAVIAADDFSLAFVIVAGIAMLSVFQFARLDANAGSSVINRRSPPRRPVAEGPVSSETFCLFGRNVK